MRLLPLALLFAYSIAFASTASPPDKPTPELPALGEEVERLVADAELMIDVARLLGSTVMAEAMFHGVRLGGTDKLNTLFAWGFGRKRIEADRSK